MSKENKVKVVLFDLDGTLADSLSTMYSVYSELLSHYGVVGSREEFVGLVGPSYDVILGRLKERHNINDSFDKLVMRAEKLIKKHYATVLPSYGAVDLMKSLADRKIRMGIVTSASTSVAKDFVKKNKIGKYIEFIVGADQVDFAKPNPGVYLRALELFVVEPDSAVAIEDSQVGVTAATCANIPTIWYAPAYRDEQMPEAALGRIFEMEQVLTYINSGTLP